MGFEADIGGGVVLRRQVGVAIQQIERQRVADGELDTSTDGPADMQVGDVGGKAWPWPNARPAVRQGMNAPPS